MNEGYIKTALENLDKALDKTISDIAQVYVSEGDHPIEARQSASDTVFEHLRGQRT